MASTPEFGFVVEYVDDIEAARRFYADVVGLRVEREHPTFVQFEHFAIASDAPVGGTGEPEVYWIVDDVQAAFARISAEAEVVQPLTELPFGTAFAVRGPAGSPRYFLQFAAERPSRAV